LLEDYKLGRQYAVLAMFMLIGIPETHSKVRKKYLMYTLGFPETLALEKL
jgi:hypothetical protein